MTWRNLKRVPRIPELAIFAILQSIMFVLLFAYVFGGAIPLPDGGSYREYLMPGIFVQTLGFASITTAIAVTDDMAKGLIDRFRSLPMARSAVLSGRTVSDVVYNAGILVVLMLSGLVVGWRVHGTSASSSSPVALMLFFTFAMAWIGVWIGLLVPSVEVGQQLGFLIIFPLTFVSNAFVPIETLPSWLQPIAEWNPFSALTAATRELFGNPNPYTSGFPGEHPIFMSLVWTVGLLVVFAPLAVRSTARSTATRRQRRPTPNQSVCCECRPGRRAARSRTPVAGRTRRRTRCPAPGRRHSAGSARCGRRCAVRSPTRLRRAHATPAARSR